MIDLIDEEKVFRPGSNRKESIAQFHKTTVLIVDNFYENPELVRDLALKIPPTYHTHRGAYPGSMVNASYDMRQLAPVYWDYIERYFPNKLSKDYVDWNIDNATFMVNVMQSPGNEELYPHIDNPSGDNFASTIYLNTPEECSGGTGFYDYDEYYTGMVDMKFNRMILYLQNVHHTAIMRKGSFTGDLYRLNQQFFI